VLAGVGRQADELAVDDGAGVDQQVVKGAAMGGAGLLGHAHDPPLHELGVAGQLAGELGDVRELDDRAPVRALLDAHPLLPGRGLRPASLAAHAAPGRGRSPAARRAPACTHAAHDSAPVRGERSAGSPTRIGAVQPRQLVVKRAGSRRGAPL
jgi:hypothetical protein